VPAPRQEALRLEAGRVGGGAGGTGGGGAAGGQGGGGGFRSLRTVVLHETARRRYLGYALSVITSRAIPDVRDGLKPVQRRILYAMHRDLKLHAKAKPRKSAAVVGEVMGRYHPHGDTAIYDAMVRMAQAFNLRYPLVDGHGNFGSLDGDPAAAMRYTEARLQPLADELLEELVGQTVAWRPNYDGTREEPVVLPSRFPCLLVNGASGIAVGIATNIPPHNLRETVAAALALLEDPTLSVAALCAHLPGPDFPTGGEILSSAEELRAIYETGRGPVRLRGSWKEERLDRKECVVISAIPYQQNKALLVEKIGSLILARKVPQLVDVRDESTTGVRIVLELKKGANAEEAMAYLCRNTNLELNFHVNLTCLVPSANPEVGAPACLDLKQILQHFLDFRLQVIRGRLEHELGLLRQRIHILEGFEKIFGAIEEAIRLVLGAKDRADAAARLRTRFGLDEEQAEAILETKLYRLARLEIATVQAELAEKRTLAARLEALLADAGALRRLLATELRQVADRYGDERRTLVGSGRELHFDPQAYVVREEAWVIVTRDGWVKRQATITDIAAVRLREGAEIGWIFRTHTLATVTFYTSLGKAYTLQVEAIKATSGHGGPVQVYFDFSDKELVVGVVCNDPRCQDPAAAPAASEAPAAGPPPAFRPPAVALPEAGAPATEEPEAGTASLDEGEEEEAGGEEPEEGEDDGPPVAGPLGVAITRAGKGLRFPCLSFAEPSQRGGRRFVKLAPEDPADAVVAVLPLTGDALVSLATREGRVLLFPARELKLLRGAGRGVQAIRLAPTDQVLAFALASGKDDGVLVVTARGREIRVCTRSYRVASRGGRGTEVIKRGGLERWVPPPLVLLGAEELPNGKAGGREAPLTGGLPAAPALPATGDASGAAPAEPVTDLADDEGVLEDAGLDEDAGVDEDEDEEGRGDE
jgi:DNA gyrase subunit A